MHTEGSYSNNIEGVPLPGDIPQVKGSAAPNREDSALLSNPEGQEGKENANDYVSREARMNASSDPENKDDREWSSGLNDEENDMGPGTFGALDNDWEEGVFAETEPLTTEDSSSVQEAAEPADSADFYDGELQPDNIQYGPE